MDKQTLLRELFTKLQTGEITYQEVSHILNYNTPAEQHTKAPEKEKDRFSMVKILYVLGSVVIIAGIIILVSQMWKDIGTLGRIAVTFGMGMLMAIIGSLLMEQKKYIGGVFHFIGGALIPGGTFVILQELSTGAVSHWIAAFSFLMIFFFYVLLYTYHRHPVLAFFAIANGTTFLYLLIGAIVDGSYYANDEIYMYLTMIIGACYLVLARGFRKIWNKHLIGILHLLGTIGFLGAGFSHVIEDSTFWKIFYFLVVLGYLALSAYMKSRSMLALSTLFLIMHISFITGLHFANSFGWPISLVILGFIFIGLGYASISINKRYISAT